MTVSEAVRDFYDGDFFDEFGFILGIDMSENGDGVPSGFTAVTEGVCGISARLSPRVIVRNFVDGDRAVPVSHFAEIRLDFLLVKGDAVQEKILSYAMAGCPLRCVYMSCDGIAFEGKMLISLSETAPGEIFGTKASAVFTAC
ncbi:MAG: hypothetical protein MSJ26_10595 [Oscillospiraceae bacterium]|nr:hypothetical protein [Oscillospiraceae bacterium]